MKNICINNPKITRDPAFSQQMSEALREQYDDSVLTLKGVEVFSDAIYPSKEPRQDKISQVFIQYTAFIREYLDLILFDNEIAEQRKQSPYSFFVSLTVDFQNSKAKLHFYLDGDIFGLVAGSGYVNIVNFIRTSFPIFSKISTDVELKLFSFSEDSMHSDFSET